MVNEAFNLLTEDHAGVFHRQIHYSRILVAFDFTTRQLKIRLLFLIHMLQANISKSIVNRYNRNGN